MRLAAHSARTIRSDDLQAGLTRVAVGLERYAGSEETLAMAPATLRQQLREVCQAGRDLAEQLDTLAAAYEWSRRLLASTQRCEARKPVWKED